MRIDHRPSTIRSFIVQNGLNAKASSAPAAIVAPSEQTGMGSDISQPTAIASSPECFIKGPAALIRIVHDVIDLKISTHTNAVACLSPFTHFQCGLHHFSISTINVSLSEHSPRFTRMALRSEMIEVVRSHFRSFMLPFFRRLI